MNTRSKIAVGGACVLISVAAFLLVTLPKRVQNYPENITVMSPTTAPKKVTTVIEEKNDPYFEALVNQKNTSGNDQSASIPKSISSQRGSGGDLDCGAFADHFLDGGAGVCATLRPIGKSA